MTDNDKKRLNALIAKAEQNMGEYYNIIVNGLKFFIMKESVFGCIVYTEPDGEPFMDFIEYNKDKLVTHIQRLADVTLRSSGHFTKEHKADF